MSTSRLGAAPKPASADDEGFKRELVLLIPHLRAFARTLTGDATAADDLAQDAMMKAWDARASYQMGTNMKAWTFMILRNQFYSEKRRSWRQSQLDQEAAERTLVAVDDPEAPVALDELRQALKTLPEEQRDQGVRIFALHFVTPVTEDYTIDYWMHLRNTAVGDHEASAQMDAMFRVAFAEDKEVLEAIHIEEQRPQKRKPIRIAIDKAPNVYRKRIRDLIEAEAIEDLGEPERPTFVQLD